MTAPNTPAMSDAPGLSAPDMPASDAAIIESCSHLSTFDDKARHIIALTRASDRAAMQEAVEALRFYADVEDYKAPFTGAMGKLWLDCGQAARAAIAKLTGGE